MKNVVQYWAKQGRPMADPPSASGRRVGQWPREGRPMAEGSASGRGEVGHWPTPSAPRQLYHASLYMFSSLQNINNIMTVVTL